MLETLVRDALTAVPELSDLLAAFEGRVIDVSVSPVTHLRVKLGHTPLFWRISPEGEARNLFTQPHEQAPTTAHLHIRGTPGNYLAFLRSGQSHHLTIEGDSTLAVNLLQHWKSLDVNWTARLSPYLGEELLSTANRASGMARHWLNRAKLSFIQDLQEYLHHEARALPQAEQSRGWLDATEKARQQTDRLSARIDALEQSMRKKDTP